MPPAGMAPGTMRMPKRLSRYSPPQKRTNPTLMSQPAQANQRDGEKVLIVNPTRTRPSEWI